MDGDASQLPPTTALHFQAPRAFVGLGDCTSGFAAALPTSKRVGEKAKVFESFELFPREGGPLLALYHLACDQHPLVASAQRFGGHLVLRGLLSALWFRGLFSHRLLHHLHHLLSTQHCGLDLLLESPSRDREMVDPFHIALREFLGALLGRFCSTAAGSHPREGPAIALALLALPTALPGTLALHAVFCLQRHPPALVLH